MSNLSQSSLDLLCDARRRRHAGDRQAFRMHADLPLDEVAAAIELVAAELEHLRTVRSVIEARAEVGAAIAAAGRRVDSSWPDGWSGR